MVKVLLYAYATGVFSSRRVARKLEEDVGFRVLAAGNFPQHRTLCEFRRRHLEDFQALFVEVVRLAQLLEGRYADCEKITLVCDNLNTHTKGAFYKVFEPTRARQLVRRIEFCYTPKHGSWLNIAENELSSLTRQCVRGRCIGDLGTLHGESVGVVHRRQWHATRCRLANEGRRCAL